jgi:hypothetical protein
MGKSGSTISAAEVYASICRIRKENSLGCAACILKGSVGCPESHGEGTPVPDVSHSSPGTKGGRPVGGYVCYLDTLGPTNFTYN